MGRPFPKLAYILGTLILLVPTLLGAQGLEIINPRPDPNEILTVVPRNSGNLNPVFSAQNLQLLHCNLAPVQPILQAVDPKENIKARVGVWNFFEQFKSPSDETDSNESTGTVPILKSNDPQLIARLAGKRLEKRLENCAVLRDQIIWQEPDGSKVPYVNWSAEKKNRLNAIFQRLDREESNLKLQCPSPAQALVPPHYLFYYDYAEAFDVFAAHVAHVLYLEAKGLVPWKVHRMAPEEVAQLLDSENYFSIIKASTKSDYPEHIVPGEDYQPLGWTQGFGPMLCNPHQAFQAFHLGLYNAPQFNGSILGPDIETTLANLTIWFRDHVHHGTMTFNSLPETFVHSFMTVASRFLLKDYDGKRRIVAFEGCHQAAGLFKEIARSLNIPLLLVATQDAPTRPGIPFPSRTHKGLCAQWSGAGGRCLWHLDEIYANSTDEPSFPIDAQGQALQDTAANLDYFRTHWVPLSELPEWGFEVIMADTIPNAQDGHLFYSTKGSAEEYENYGPFLGFWQLSDRAQVLWDQDNGQTSHLEFLDLSRYLRFIHLIQTGSYYFLQDPCEDIPQIRNIDLNNRMQGLRSAQPPPITFTVPELEQRMQNIVQAYGDSWGNCANIQAAHQAFATKRDSL